MADEINTPENGESAATAVDAAVVAGKKPRTQTRAKASKSASAAAVTAVPEKTGKERKKRAPRAKAAAASSENAAAAPAKKTRATAATAKAAATVAPVSATDEMADLLRLEDENKRLRQSLAEKLRAENADLRKRLGLA